MLRITGFDHFVLRCQDVDTSLRWYVDVPVRAGPRRGVAERRRAVPVGAAPAESIIDLIPADGRSASATLTTSASSPTEPAWTPGRRRRHAVQRRRRTSHPVRAKGEVVRYVTDPDDNMVEIRTYDD